MRPRQLVITLGIMAALLGARRAQADVTVAPDHHDFGAQLVGTLSKPVEVRVENASDSAVEINAVSLSGAAASYQLAWTGRFSMAPRERKNINVTCTPLGLGQQRATLIIAPAGQPPRSIELSCVGAQHELLVDSGQADPNVLDLTLDMPLAYSFASATAAAKLTVAPGSYPMRLGELPSSNPDFSAAWGGLDGGELHAGQSTSLTVYATPSIAGVSSATISIMAEGDASPVATLQVRATSIASTSGPFFGSTTGACAMGGGREVGATCMLFPAVALLGLALRRRRRSG